MREKKCYMSSHHPKNANASCTESSDEQQSQRQALVSPTKVVSTKQVHGYTNTNDERRTAEYLELLTVGPEHAS